MQSGWSVAARPAVIVGGELNGLGVCRSLARGNVPAYVLARRRFDAAMWSRYATPVASGALHGQALIDQLRVLAGRFEERPALIITDELALLTISEFRDEIRTTYRCRLPEHATVMMLHNKAQFHEFAVARDIPVPQAEVLRGAADIRRIQRLRVPVIVKPADKRIVHAGRVLRVAAAPDWKSAAALSRKLLDATGEVIVQECIEGPDSSIYFCLFYRAAGQTTVMYTGRKLASSPPGTGSTALCTAAGEIAKILEPLTHSFLEAVEYQGFGSVEYKWDPASGRFVVIEPTVGRTDWQEEIATLSGVNIPLVGYCREYDLPVPATVPDQRTVWQASFVERIKAATAPLPTDTIVVDGYWRRDDPLPALVHYPKDFVISAPSMVGALARRWRREPGGRVDRPGRFRRAV